MSEPAIPCETPQHPCQTLAWPLAMLFLALTLVWVFLTCGQRALGLQPIDVSRAQAIADDLGPAGDSASAPRVFLFGSSIVREGIDAAIVEQEVLGKDIVNFGLPEGGFFEAWMYARRAAQAKPQAVVIVAAYSQFERTASVKPTYWRLAIAMDLVSWERDADHEILAKLGDTIQTAARHGTLDAIWQSRRYVRDWADETALTALRPDLRFDGYITNFRDPWTGTAPMPPELLRRLAREQSLQFKEAAFDPDSPGIICLEAACKSLRAANVTPIVLLAPVNPVLHDVYPATFCADARAHLVAGVSAGRFTLIDHERVLGDSTDWLDVLHASAEGRRRWSLRLGQDLKDMLARQP